MSTILGQCGCCETCRYFAKSLIAQEIFYDYLSPTLSQINSELDVLRNYVNGQDLTQWSRLTDPNHVSPTYFSCQLFRTASVQMGGLPNPATDADVYPYTGFSAVIPASYFGYHHVGGGYNYGTLVVCKTIIYIPIDGSITAYETQGESEFNLDLGIDGSWMCHVPDANSLVLSSCSNYQNAGDTVITVPTGYFANTNYHGKANYISDTQCPP